MGQTLSDNAFSRSVAGDIDPLLKRYSLPANTGGMAALTFAITPGAARLALIVPSPIAGLVSSMNGFQLFR